MNEQPLPRLDRRTAIKWMLTAAASAAVARRDAFAAEPAAALPASEFSPGKGYGADPDLLKTYTPGAVWPLSFNEQERGTAVALCDLIIPADAASPAASQVGVPDFIDEWISAPYLAQGLDRTMILEGLAWLDAESQRRFALPFDHLVHRQKALIADDICYVPKAAPEFKVAAEFFQRFRDLAAGGFYTTPAGMKDIGYVGNIPLASFDGPPDSLIKKLGL